MVVRMRVTAVSVEQLTGAPVVVLVEEAGRRALPLAVGLLEARAIAAGLQRIELSRPMAHCLMARLLAALGAKVARVEIRRGGDDGRCAVVHLRHDGRDLAVEARPSDAIALGLRVGAPLWAEAALLDPDGPLCVPAEVDAEVEREFLSAMAEEPPAAG